MKKNIYITILIIILIILIFLGISTSYKIYTSSKILKAQNSSSETNNTIQTEKVLANIEASQTSSDVNNRETEIKNKIEKYGKNTTGIPVLMYHFFYDTSLGEKGVDNNFLELSKFEEHLNYLKDNDFFFPTFSELELFIDGKIDLPAKSVILTIDDGNQTFFRLAVPVIEKSEIPVTSFVITGSCDYNINDYKSEYVNFESHSNDMHRAGQNGKGLFVNLDYESSYNDIQTSISILNSNEAFCYPFGHYNNLAKTVVKDSGFKVAFTTNYGRVKVGMDKFTLPRVRILRDDTLNSFISKVNPN